jgi:hypothetical protein
MPPLTPDEALTAFLRINHPEHYCAACLALQFQLSLEEARQTLGRLLGRRCGSVRDAGVSQLWPDTRGIHGTHRG